MIKFGQYAIKWIISIIENVAILLDFFCGGGNDLLLCLVDVVGDNGVRSVLLEWVAKDLNALVARHKHSLLIEFKRLPEPLLAPLAETYPVVR